MLTTGLSVTSEHNMTVVNLIRELATNADTASSQSRYSSGANAALR
jgi:hypothetical protein